MTSIENFPDSHALDADAQHIPLGPQDPSVHTDLSTSFENHDAVDTVVVQQEHRRGRGRLQFLVSLDCGCSSPVERARAVADDVLSAPMVFSVEENPRRVGAAWPPEQPIDAVISVSRHPLVPFIDAVTTNEPTIHEVDYSWPVNTQSIPSSPATVSWDDVPALTVNITGADPSLDTVVSRINERVVSTIPHEYATAIQRSDDVGVRELTFSFTRHDTTNSQSGVYRADAESLTSIVDEYSDNIQLTVTSPPYLDVVDYENYTETNGVDDWSETNDNPVDEKLNVWKTIQETVFRNVFEATRDGGYCAVVIGHVKTNDSKWIPLPHEFMDVMTSIGWEFHERIIWNKVTNGSPRFGTTIQNPHPTYYYPNQMHEEIIVLRKGDPVRRRDSNEQLVMSDVTKSDVANNVWHVPPVPHNKDINHPAPFPEELVHRLVSLYSHPGDIVADPMIGSGTTGVVADRLDRVVVGTERQPVFAAEARKRLHTEQYERSNQLIPSFERVDGDSDRATLTETKDTANMNEKDEPVQTDFSSF